MRHKGPGLRSRDWLRDHCGRLRCSPHSVVAAGLSYGALFNDVFNLEPSKGLRWWGDFLAEILYTCMLSFVVLNSAAAGMIGCDTGDRVFGLATGFVIIVGGCGADHPGTRSTVSRLAS